MSRFKSDWGLCNCGRCYYERGLIDMAKKPANKNLVFWKLIRNGGHWWK